MTDTPFSTWGSHLEDARLTNAARRMVTNRAMELAAGRNYNEALSYYSGGQWTADGVDVQELDALIHQLARDQERASALRRDAEDELGALIAAIEPEQSSTLTRDRLLEKALAELGQQLDLAAQSPLDEFVAARRMLPAGEPDSDDGDDAHSRPKRRSR